MVGFSDFDECEAERHVCNPGETCVNMPGGYRCTPRLTMTPADNCKSGFHYSASVDSCIGKQFI